MLHQHMRHTKHSCQTPLSTGRRTRHLSEVCWRNTLERPSFKAPSHASPFACWATGTQATRGPAVSTLNSTPSASSQTPVSPAPSPSTSSRPNSGSDNASNKGSGGSPAAVDFSNERSKVVPGSTTTSIPFANATHSSDSRDSSKTASTADDVAGGAASSSSHASNSSTSTPPSAAAASDPIAFSPRKEAQLTLEQYQQIYDRLIKIFMERPRDDWKKLIVFSKQWNQHADGLFNRIKQIGDKEEDVDKKMSYRKLYRALQNVHTEVQRYNTVLLKFSEAAEDEWEAIMTVYRADLQRPFFEHMQCLLAVSKSDPVQTESLVALNTKLVALCANHDSIEADQEKLAAAAVVYRDLLSSINSVEEADAKMAELSKQGKIDPAFLQITAKAYGAARDTNMTLEEAKWVSYKLYRTARDQFDRQQPPEKRILEYLCTIRDPQERRNQLDQAVTPGPTPETEKHSYLYSTPQRLFAVLDGTLNAYAAMQEGATKQLGTPGQTMLPHKVRVMMELRQEIIKRYL